MMARIAYKSRLLGGVTRIFSGKRADLKPFTTPTSGKKLYGIPRYSHFVEPSKVRQIDAKTEAELDAIDAEIEAAHEHYKQLCRDRYELLEKRFSRFKHTYLGDVDEAYEAEREARRKDNA